MGRCVIVLALPRSGSSCVSGALHRLGVNMGEDHLQPNDKLNPRGYYEDRRWQKFHKGMAGTRYGTRQPDKLPEKFLVPIYNLAVECNENPIWGYKSPRACFTHHLVTPIIQQVTNDIKVVVVNRSLVEVKQSIKRHSQKVYSGTVLTKKQASDLIEKWNKAKLERLEWFRDEGIPTHTINFPELLANTWEVLEGLSDFVFNGYEKYFCGINSAALWVDPLLVHFRGK